MILNLQTIDDLHKPALDGIGYQDLIQEQMVGNTSKNGVQLKTVGKQPAWLDYMTNYFSIS